MDEIAALIVERDPRLARDLRDVVAGEVPITSAEELDDLWPIGGADDHQTDADSPEYRRPRRLGEFKLALDAALLLGDR